MDRLFGYVCLIIAFVEMTKSQSLCGLNHISNVGSNFGPQINSNLGPNLPGYNGLNIPGQGYQGFPGFSAKLGTGGAFSVTSSSRVPASGISVLAENLVIEGPLSVGGQLPFLGTIGLEGTLPGSGFGAVSYGCGNTVAISENAVNGLGPYSLAGNSAPVCQTCNGLAGFGNGLRV